MGAEHSRRVPFSHDDLPLSVALNNQLPLKFHTIHGDNVGLNRDSSIASRDEGFCKGIVFSQRPIAINEHIYIRIVELSTSWSGGLRIGFTSTDPAFFRQKLPKYACPCLTDLPGNWARALAERVVQKDCVIFYYVNQKGEVYYGFNGEERGIFFSGVSTAGKLWAMMDIYGNTIRIELINDYHYFRNLQLQRNDGPHSISITDSSTGASTSLVKMYRDSWIPLHFHPLCGNLITLDEERLFAEKSLAHEGEGYVFLAHPMTANDCAVIQILSTSGLDKNEMVIGFTSCDPNALRPGDFPNNIEDLLDRPEYWSFDTICESSKRGDIFIIAINNNGAVQYSRNGSQFATVFYVDHTLHLWMFMDLNTTVYKVRCEGLLHAIRNCNASILIESFGRQSFYSPDLPSNRNVVPGPFISQQPPPADTYNECVICCESDINCALYRCGHVCLCFECGKELQNKSANCPICRKKIEDVIKIYK